MACAMTMLHDKNRFAEASLHCPSFYMTIKRASQHHLAVDCEKGVGCAIGDCTPCSEKSWEQNRGEMKNLPPVSIFGWPERNSKYAPHVLVPVHRT